MGLELNNMIILRINLIKSMAAIYNPCWDFFLAQLYTIILFLIFRYYN
jgi:hypothetical protein